MQKPSKADCKRAQVAGAAAVLALACLSAPARAADSAADFPNRPIRVVLPTSAGSGVDITIRAIGQKLSEAWGQAVVVDNRPGANGIIGMDVVRQSKPDGYTWLQGFTSVLTINPHVYQSLSYNVARDFQPITQTVTNTMVLVSNPSLPAKNVKELVALARKRPGELSYASAGVGNLTHLVGALLGMETGTKLLHVPYKGESNAHTALIAGETGFMFSVALGIVPHVKAGKLRLLASCGEKRATAFPDVPTMVESGLPQVIATGWGGLLAPAGTPADITRKIQQETARQLHTAELKARLSALGTEPVGSTPDAFAAFLRSESDKWARVTRQAGIAAK